MADLEPAELFAHDAPLELSFVDALEIRNNFTALARSFYTTDTLKPLDARNGQVRVNASVPGNITLDVFLSGAWRTMVQQIDKGIPSPIKQIAQFNTPAASWVVDHNLGSQVVACVYDVSFIQLTPVNIFDTRSIPLARIDTALAVGPALTGWPVDFNGNILSTYAVVEGAPLVGAGVLSVDFTVDKTPGGGGLVPVGGGTIPLAAAATGVIIPGSAVVSANVFSLVDADLLNVVTSGTPLTSGIVQVGIRAQRTLNPGEYRLTQVNENRIAIDHAEPVAGFVVLVG